MLSTLQRKLARNGKRLFIAGANAQPLSLFARSGFVEVLGEQNLCASVAEVIGRLRTEPRDQ
jgi:SulP family sulfate permease